MLIFKNSSEELKRQDLKCLGPKGGINGTTTFGDFTHRAIYPTRGKLKPLM